jgi:hypothetical protein
VRHDLHFSFQPIDLWAVLVVGGENLFRFLKQRQCLIRVTQAVMQGSGRNQRCSQIAPKPSNLGILRQQFLAQRNGRPVLAIWTAEPLAAMPERSQRTVR